MQAYCNFGFIIIYIILIIIYTFFFTLFIEAALTNCRVSMHIYGFTVYVWGSENSKQKQ